MKTEKEVRNRVDEIHKLLVELAVADRARVLWDSDYTDPMRKELDSLYWVLGETNAR